MASCSFLYPRFSVKRQTQQKKRKERERKELDALGRRHFANVRVVQRNVVYVVGLGPRFAKEEVLCATDPRFLSLTSNIAHPDSQIKRVFWTIWQDLQNYSRQTSPPRIKVSSSWALYHVSSP